MLLKRKSVIPDVRYLLAYAAIGSAFVLALVLRVSLYHIETSDYTGQVNGGGVGASSSSTLTANAPSFYQWLPVTAPAYWKWIGIFPASAFVVFISGLLVASKKRIVPEIVLKVALVFVIAIPFLLPEMHDRYFYLADVISIVAAFYFPRMFYVAIGVQLCSLLSYAPYLLHTEIVSLAYVAVVVLVLVIITTADLVVTLYPDIRKHIVAADAV